MCLKWKRSHLKNEFSEIAYLESSFYIFLLSRTLVYSVFRHALQVLIIAKKLNIRLLQHSLISYLSWSFQYIFLSQNFQILVQKGAFCFKKCISQRSHNLFLIFTEGVIFINYIKQK